MLYISIPFALFICYLMILITSGVLPLTEPPVPLKEGMLYYSFFYDLTNSFVLPYLLFFIYFVSGKFISYLKDRIRAFEERYVTRGAKPLKRSFISSLIILFVALIAGAFSSTLFIDNAAAQVGAHAGVMVYWYAFIGDFEMLYYRFLIFYVFSKSVHFFLSCLLDMFILCSYKKRFTCNVSKFSHSVVASAEELFKDLRSCFLFEFFFGVYYLIAVATVFYSDYRAYTLFKVDFALAGASAWYVLILTIILGTVYFGGVYVTRVGCIEDYERPLGICLKNNNKPPFSIDIGKILVFLVTTVLPAVTPLLQSFFILKK